MTKSVAEVVYREWIRVDAGRPGVSDCDTDGGAEAVAPADRGGHAAASVSDGTILAMCGADRTGSSFDDVWELRVTRSDAGGDAISTDAAWRRALGSDGKPVCITPARSGVTAASLGADRNDSDTVVVFGGQDPMSGVCFNDTHIMQRRKAGSHDGAWALERVAAGAPTPPARHSHVCIGLDDRLMLLFGGASTSHGLLNDVWIFDSHEKRWSLQKTEGSSPIAREMAAGVVVRKQRRATEEQQPSDPADGNPPDETRVFPGELHVSTRGLHASKRDGLNICATNIMHVPSLINTNVHTRVRALTHAYSISLSMERSRNRHPRRSE